MRLIAFLDGDREGIGFVDSRGGYRDSAELQFPNTIAALITNCRNDLGEVRKVDVEGLPSLPETARIVAPLVPRRNIFCVGKNYRAHAKEFGRSGFDSAGDGDVPDAPIIFSKATTSVVGPDEPIPHANDPFDTLDYEGELAVIIGREGRRINRASALQHVFGYTIINDLTSRGAQKTHKQWLLAKGIDGFCPMGPSVVTADEIADPADLRIVTTVNGQIRQDAMVADLIFDVPSLIATISSYISLLPGDIIATGTPEGVGIGFTPPKFLQPGDVVAVSIPPIGVLKNTVV